MKRLKRKMYKILIFILLIITSCSTPISNTNMFLLDSIDLSNIKNQRFTVVDTIFQYEVDSALSIDTLSIRSIKSKIYEYENMKYSILEDTNKNRYNYNILVDNYDEDISESLDLLNQYEINLNFYKQLSDNKNNNNICGYNISIEYRDKKYNMIHVKYITVLNNFDFLCYSFEIEKIEK